MQVKTATVLPGFSFYFPGFSMAPLGDVPIFFAQGLMKLDRKVDTKKYMLFVVV